MSTIRTPSPSDVSDDEWSFVAPYLTLLPDDVSQRTHDLREVFNGLRYLVKTGVHWRMLPHDLPPWPMVYQQMRRWMAAGCFETIVHDLRVLVRRATRATRSRVRRFWTAARSNRRPRAGHAPATTGTSAARA